MNPIFIPIFMNNGNKIPNSNSDIELNWIDIIKLILIIFIMGVGFSTILFVIMDLLI
jgi:hypothetical protein